MEKVQKYYESLNQIFSIFCDEKPLIAYYIKLWAVKKCLKMMDKMSGEDAEELWKEIMESIPLLEEMKKNLSNIDEEDKKESYENFVLSTFSRLDQDEWTCETITLIHAKQFRELSLLIETLNIIFP